MMDFDTVTTYQNDLALFKKLGLKPFSTKCKETYFVGKLKNDYGNVDIKVTGLPAQFWEFDIWCATNQKHTKLSTGSGSLSEYWPTVELILKDMIVIESIS